MDSQSLNITYIHICVQVRVFPSLHALASSYSNRTPHCESAFRFVDVVVVVVIEVNVSLISLKCTEISFPLFYHMKKARFLVSEPRFPTSSILSLSLSHQLYIGRDRMSAVSVISSRLLLLPMLLSLCLV